MLGSKVCDDARFGCLCAPCPWKCLPLNLLHGDKGPSQNPVIILLLGGRRTPPFLLVEESTKAW